MLNIEDRFWSEILSGDPQAVRRMWAALNRQERGIVKGHLDRLASEDGWSEEQRQAAQAALSIIESEAVAC